MAARLWVTSPVPLRPLGMEHKSRRRTMTVAQSYDEVCRHIMNGKTSQAVNAGNRLNLFCSSAMVSIHREQMSSRIRFRIDQTRVRARQQALSVRARRRLRRKASRIERALTVFTNVPAALYALHEAERAARSGLRERCMAHYERACELVGISEAEALRLENRISLAILPLPAPITTGGKHSFAY